MIKFDFRVWASSWHLGIGASWDDWHLGECDFSIFLGPFEVAIILRRTLVRRRK